MTLLEQLEQTPPAAKMVLPGAVLLLVSRQRHPILWWLFGVIPMASAVAQVLTEGRLFGPPKAPLAPGPTPFLPADYPGSKLPDRPDFTQGDGSPGYFLR